VKRLAPIVVALGLFAAACAGQGAVRVERLGDGPSSSPSRPAPSGPTSSPASTPNGSPAGPGPSATPPGEPSGTVTLQVWFARDDHLFVVTRSLPATVAVGRAALTALMQGPTPQERAAGVSSTVPAGTQLRDLNIENGVATVDLMSAFASGGGSASVLMRVASVVYTITQFPAVQGVDFWVEGKPITSLGGEGLILDHPVTRTDFEDQLPAVLVTSPSIGASVSSPVAVTGTANVFEATVSIRILDQDGHVLVDTFATATCGTGCRGSFSAPVSFHVEHAQPGTVMAFEASAQDGSPTNVVEIPVTLQT
jgi:germination protein M